MNLFSKFFGKSNNSNAMIADNHASDTMTEDNINVLEGLFINNQPPVEPVEKEAEKASCLKTYLEQDFFRKGFDDGYNGHAAELLENKIRSMKADFRYNLNLKIDQARQEILKLDNHKINVEGMSERLVKQLDNQINAFKANMVELEAEIALADIDQGYVMIGVYQYRDGFIRGTEAYQEEKLIAGSTGLFV
ncbi:MAG: hypothetical protein V1775_19000 [Bacteroidota bacterium]